MEQRRVGVVVTARDASSTLAKIEQAERIGIPAVWLTSGAGGIDALTLFAAAIPRTHTTLLGTSIVPTWLRHPVVMAQQARTLAELSPGRFRLGVGPSHQLTMEGNYGVEFHRPLGHLQEYLRILKPLLQEGEVNFDGRYYRAHARTPGPVDVPVMASALRRGSFELCGAEADGAITWVCPGAYLRDVALPSIRTGAKRAGLAVPPLIAHAPVCVHDNHKEVLAAAREQLGYYSRAPFYARMFADSGFPEAAQGTWSEAMIDAVVVSGDEPQVAEGLQRLFSLGATELLVSIVAAGENKSASANRSLQLIAQVAKKVAWDYESIE